MINKADVLLDRRITVQWGQVVVHDADHSAPGLLWTDDDVAQGFARSEGIVAFGLPDHDGEVRLRVSCGGDAWVGAGDAAGVCPCRDGLG
jgi:hypothetical protein